MGVIIVGLGPGDGRYLTREAWDVLSSAEAIYVRTRNHPAVGDLPPDVRVNDFDRLYEEMVDFEAVYGKIADEILGRAMKSATDVIYAVPGHPLVGEAAVLQIIERADEAGLQLRLVEGMSFVEPVLRAVGYDPFDGFQLFNALDLARAPYPALNPDQAMLVVQLFDPLVAGDLKLALSEFYAEDHQVTVVRQAGLPGELKREVPLYTIDRQADLDQLTTLFVPPRRAVGSLAGFADSIAVLRGPGGCPWDRAQTSQSMRDGFMEEVAEALDAIDRADEAALCDELGDVLLHIVFQAQIAREEAAFTLTDIIAGIDAKMKRRHPHVWGEVDVADADQVVDNWAAIKARERQDEESESVLVNIPYALPALARSLKIQKRVRKVGFDWPSVDGVWEKLAEETEELRRADSPAEQVAEFGDLLFVAVNLAQWLGIDPEIALREANLKFERRFRTLEELMRRKQLAFSQLGLDGLNQLWDEAKSLVG